MEKKATIRSYRPQPVADSHTLQVRRTCQICLRGQAVLDGQRGIPRRCCLVTA